MVAKKILVAEDEKSLRLLYSRELADEGYDVLLAESATQAVSMVRDRSPDLVVLDIKMPGMDGIEALYKILDIRNDLPVILNTSYPFYEQNYLSWAADAYVVKSSDLTELKGTISRLIGHA